MSFALEITTAVAEPKKFTIDKHKYDLYSTDHLSPEQEAQVQALFARHDIIRTELDMARNTNQGRPLAESLRKTRLQIIGMLTNVTKDVLDKLPLSGQVKLLEAIQHEMAYAGDDDATPEDGGDDE